MSNTQSNLHSHSRDADLLRTLALALGQPVVIAGMTLSGPRYHHDHPTALSLATLNADTVNLQHWSTTADIAPLSTPDHPINGLWQNHWLIAHSARLHYAYLKATWARADQNLQLRTLCAQRLRQTLNLPVWPLKGDASERLRQTLDSLHDALEQAGLSTVQTAISTLKKRPSLPPYLDETLVDEMPTRCGVYFFHGDSGLLYVGKAKNIRQRVLSHFSNDISDAKEMRMAQQVRHITWEITAGELGALLREARYVKTLQPLHNRQLRRQQKLISLTLAANPDGLLQPHWLDSDAVNAAQSLYGLFTSPAAGSKFLRQLASNHGLCDYALALERRLKRPCPSRQLKRCQGLCDGSETIMSHNQRLQAALTAHAVMTWPFDGAVVITETDASNGDTDFHVIQHWCWLGSTAHAHEIEGIARTPTQALLDKDSYRLLVKALLGLSPLPHRLLTPSAC
jgi:DNA polymerase-3 subunit epsilon